MKRYAGQGLEGSMHTGASVPMEMGNTTLRYIDAFASAESFQTPAFRDFYGYLIM